MELLTELIGILGVVAIFVIGTICVQRLISINQKSVIHKILSGLIFGAMIVVAMIDPIKISEGATFDPRGGPAILAGVFAGPLGALVAGIIGALARWYVVGGPFALGGVVGFAIYGLFGAFVGILIKRREWHLSPLFFAGLGLLGTAVVLPAFFVSADIATGLLVIKKAGLLVLSNNVLSSLLVGVVFYQTAEWASLRHQLDDEQEKTLLLSRIADETINGVIITNEQGYVEWVNSGFERITGYSLSEVLGRKPGDVLQREDVDPEVREHMRTRIAQVKPFNVNVLNYTKAGNPYRLDISCQPFVGHDGKTRFMAIETDATDRVLNQELLEKAKEDAEMANSAKSNFLATMSHEIRTPLNGVLGLAQLLKDTNLDEDQENKVNTILSSGQTLLAIINDVLDMSKIEAGGLELEEKTFSLQGLVSTIATPFQSLADDKGIELTVSSDIRSGMVIKGDPVRLRQILWNLLSNAIKFTEQGWVVLTIEVIDAPNDSDAISTPKDHVLYFAVEDTGAGIASDRIDAIFDAFTQEDSSITRKHGGTGLGLSIVKQLTEIMGGTITAKSELGKGTTFTAHIPFKAATDEETDAILLRTPNRENQKAEALNILVAEDNEVNAVIAKAFLAKLGHSVRHVENGKLAVESVKEGWADLILMDIHMPEMNGIDATKEIRSTQIGRNIPIVGLTAEAFTDRHVQFIEAGMVDVLTKPFTEQQLSDMLAANRPIGRRSESLGSEIGIEEVATGQTFDDVVNSQTEPTTAAKRTSPVGDEENFSTLRTQLPAEVISELLTEAQSSLLSRLAELQQAVQANDQFQIRESAHSIKGASGSMYAMRVSEIAGEIEKNSSDIEAVHGLMEEFEFAASDAIEWWGEQSDQTDKRVVTAS